MDRNDLKVALMLINELQMAGQKPSPRLAKAVMSFILTLFRHNRSHEKKLAGDIPPLIR